MSYRPPATQDTPTLALGSPFYISGTLARHEGISWTSPHTLGIENKTNGDLVGVSIRPDYKCSRCSCLRRRRCDGFNQIVVNCRAVAVAVAEN